MVGREFVVREYNLGLILGVKEVFGRMFVLSRAEGSM
jgi:hypothetical protein